MKKIKIVALAISVTLATFVNAEYLFKHDLPSYIELNEAEKETKFTITAVNNDVYGGEKVYLVVDVEDESLINSREFPIWINIRQIAIVSGEYIYEDNDNGIVDGFINDFDDDGVFEVLTKENSGFTISYHGTNNISTNTTWMIDINK